MSSDSLPYAADAEISLKREELDVLRNQYVKEEPFVSIQTKFNYAWGLIKSPRRDEQQLGVRLLTEIFRDAPERRRECLYYLALGHYKLGNYVEARRYNDLLMDREPNNMQARSLNKLIDDRVAKEGLVGLAIIGGAVAAGGIILGTLLKRRR
ncbi:hypothetical protein POJ06DRAFT_256013 [Lipomyces tetrasporus]|uniref:Mitochondrial fission 1 protein n=1 Tax=Lipomyces tetrasporus TaxID=54092 RepID=A0AAD7VQN5_9ASCO|nr:uncharacterized protein POJ06DRAFT_256013 [Lipomyces tetrasporus]KAJ8099112.1 hypothetical protein POJ06DRAFT_256013 [Lipomyces tetrasporus]